MSLFFVPLQIDLSFFIRLFEPLVLRALHQYPVITCPELQSKILELITVLVEFGVNYSGLDEQSVSRCLYRAETVPVFTLPPSCPSSLHLLLVGVIAEFFRMCVFNV
ncbi:unnamed protein product [Dibothriocephalus latus]|uniref:Uncharacterized protein n=1 Tax=Dibothriocephalus latus TaxID=60516 RepID=A0A3P7RGV7_DIBLA|nr:unnamed protein product [Dibothriocephalus latus]